MKWDLTSLARVNRPAETGAIRLRPSAIYILPTPFGLVFFILLVLLLIGSINYANNLGFLLTFFLASVGLLAMIHSWRNLLGLCLMPRRCHPVFAGEACSFEFDLSAPTERLRGDLELSHPSGALSALDFDPGQIQPCFHLELPSKVRGLLPLGRCRLETRYPLGLFRAWCYIHSDLRGLIYPRPEPWNLEMSTGSEAADNQGFPRRTPAGQDFHGIRQYQPGDPLKSIHWQSLARGNELMSREYESQIARDLWLDLAAMPGPHTEIRLGQLCYAVLQAAEQGHPFGIRLGGLEIAPDLGEQHLQRVLRALALFGKAEAA
jgi:uncharacterized protein (DUF58 family)